MKTPEEIETELKSAATKEELHKEMLANTRWLIGTMILLQIPTWVGMLQIWAFLASIAAHLPKP
jgi:putative effector of murein hydrolase LrgA (UPF0299 family)